MLSLEKMLPAIRVPPPGPKSRELALRLAAVECPAFGARRAARLDKSGEEQTPIVYAFGQDAVVFDVDDNRYVDLAAGFGALILGHAPARILNDVRRHEVQLTLALGDVYASEIKVALIERLAALYPEPGARVLLGMSGADAVTAAMKTAVLATGRAGIIAFEGSYHGLSHGPLALCGLGEKFRAPFFEHTAARHVRFAQYPRAGADLGPCVAKIEEAMKAEPIAAVVVEPLLGRGGCVDPPEGFLGALRRLCDEQGALLVADEVWTGCGRSGSLVASLDEGVLPDVVCLGKGLGGGFPISACIGSAKAMAAWAEHGGGTIHTATHFGAPPACAAAMATLDAVRDHGLPARAKSLGERWMRDLESKTRGLGVRAVTGRGLMIGVHLEGGAGRTLATMRGLLQRGFIAVTGGIHGDVLTFSPPLVITEPQLDAATEALVDALGPRGEAA